MTDAGGKQEIAIIGLGLMGGSMALALKKTGGYLITGYSPGAETRRAASKAGALDHMAGSAAEAVRNADISFFCAPPNAVIDEIRACAAFFKPGSVVSEVCGVKEEVFREITASLPAGVSYVGVHPMAGKERGGFANADENLYKNAGFILMYADDCPEESVRAIERLIRDLGSERVCRNTPAEHDRIIAYTSDLMHVASAALCRQYAAGMTLAHTAGAFRDCTRVADIDAGLWTELLLMNARHVAPVLGEYIRNLTDFKAALEHGYEGAVYGFLKTAGDNKRKINALKGVEQI
ncbi:MAG: prephenate dehydrogenase/arogenate dehydrogenase family protein [Firmicutes bacterium]|nr:prephenate dehydrogenase/arogenate dehydrogenase family protein [Bacillota bacterium]